MLGVGCDPSQGRRVRVRTSTAMRAPGGTFISARTARIADRSSTTHSISAAAAGSCRSGGRSGQGAAISIPASAAGELPPQLLGDERHDRMQQMHESAPAPRRSSRGSRPSPPRRRRCRIGLVNSRYQSQKVPQMKW